MEKLLAAVHFPEQYKKTSNGPYEYFFIYRSKTKQRLTEWLSKSGNWFTQKGNWRWHDSL